MKIIFLGTGTSVGVPTIGCDCRVCRSTDPHDKRLRCSALVETGDTRILIDPGPDFRQQMLSQPFRKIDAVLLTHIHYDHAGGIDDLRPFCKFGEVNVYADNVTADALMNTIPYCFAENRYPGVPNINLIRINRHEAIRVNDISVMPFEVMHGSMPITAYRIGKLAYITDMKSIKTEEIAMLDGVDTLVVNALRYAPDHYAHQSVDDAVAFSRRVGARKTYLIHSCHDIGLHAEVNEKLPPGVQLAFDGQEVEVDCQE
ncbi:MAG: MBL fold metallo-hydrolase [Prevotella sp.]|uniref:MBL fold metallo-hydrolase n=1 Tax=Prevotella sp. TaxID=59823 RepID=UPI002A2FBBAC|nr:MBL fold metallo-hydrolase [Prevotella sp.]MDD7318698.1 MBL fold metallo-hydrolase [Prevotellaceae bacterium]MDY4019341.1 MBL fold metallo-hydrolase [Prevotella sp.]